MTMTMRLILPFLVLPMLAGCSALSALGEASQPLQIYELRTPALEASYRRRNVELVVEEPVTGGALATERIMIRPTPLQAQYLPDIRWADAAPAMLQTLMVRSLMETGALESVGRRPVGTRADFALLSELTDFQAETVAGSEGVTVRLRLVLRLVRESDARVIATRAFAVAEPAVATDAESVVAAFDRASARLISEFVPWVISRVGR